MHILKSRWHRVWLILLCGVLAAVVGFSVSSFGMTPMYSSSVMLYVNNNSLSLGNTDFTISASQSSAAQSFVKTYSVILESRTTLEKVIEKTGVPYTAGQLKGVVKYQGKEYVYKDNIETFLVIGIDRFDDSPTADSHESEIQTDFLLLIILDNDTKQSTAIQINRDTMTKVNYLSVGGTTVVDSYIRQIALAYNYANDDNDKIRCRNTKDSVEYLLNNIDIDHYMSVTLDSVAASCDLVGGVEVTILDDFTSIDETMVKGEKVTLNGEQAHKYVRTRKGLEDSTNIARMARQQQYMTALYHKIISRMENDEEFALKMIDTLDEYVVYDSSNYRMQKIAEKMDEYEFMGIKQIEGESKLGEEFMEFYADEDSIWEIVIDLFYIPKDNK